MNVSVAVLYQSTPPPVHDGIVKPMKPGGYADSGADIAYTLSECGIRVVTPVARPNVSEDLDWVFPDTTEGIQQALDSGADCLWLNTVLFKGHPVEQFEGILVVGQLPSAVDRYDDKWYTNNLLRSWGLPVPQAELITAATSNAALPATRLPLVAKPIRGRGSAGVTLITDAAQYHSVIAGMFAADRFGTAVYIEEYLPGRELTVTVMPPGIYTINGKEEVKSRPWCLPGVERFNHADGIAPYNGAVAVVNNSRVLSDEQEATPAVQILYEQCEEAATLVALRAPIRIDCRADAKGHFYLFDLNMKPNMTGPARAQRQDQDSLTALAARKIQWSYGDLLLNLLRKSWRLE